MFECSIEKGWAVSVRWSCAGGGSVQCSEPERPSGDSMVDAIEFRNAVGLIAVMRSFRNVHSGVVFAWFHVLFLLLTADAVTQYSFDGGINDVRKFADLLMEEPCANSHALDY